MQPGNYGAFMPHDSYSNSEIARVLRETRSIAMLGASANEVRPSYFVMKYLLLKGYSVTPINPGHAGKTILDRMTFASLNDLPEPVEMIDVFRPSTALPQIVSDVLALPWRPKVFWTQLTVRDDDAVAHLEAEGVTVIQDRCPKIEFARLSGEIGWNGINSRRISARKPVLGKTVQSYSLPENE